jgi:hypothetical protein
MTPLIPAVLPSMSNTDAVYADVAVPKGSTDNHDCCSLLVLVAVQVTRSGWMQCPGWRASSGGMRGVFVVARIA